MTINSCNLVLSLLCTFVMMYAVIRIPHMLPGKQPSILIMMQGFLMVAFPNHHHFDHFIKAPQNYHKESRKVGKRGCKKEVEHHQQQQQQQRSTNGAKASLRVRLNTTGKDAKPELTTVSTSDSSFVVTNKNTIEENDDDCAMMETAETKFNGAGGSGDLRLSKPVFGRTDTVFQESETFPSTSSSEKRQSKSTLIKRSFVITNLAHLNCQHEDGNEDHDEERAEGGRGGAGAGGEHMGEGLYLGDDHGVCISPVRKRAESSSSASPITYSMAMASDWIDHDDNYSRHRRATRQLNKADLPTSNSSLGHCRETLRELKRHWLLYCVALDKTIMYLQAVWHVVVPLYLFFIVPNMAPDPELHIEDEHN